MTSSPQTDNSYIFNRDNRSTIRLNYQHWLIKQLTGYLIHPAIPTQTPCLRVADIGTGTGIWPIETAGLLPNSARIDGFDISSAQYPCPQWLPSNVHLHVHNAFRPFPDDFHTQFDVVHIRFFVTLLNGENLVPLINNLMTLLKPGGYLQWIDLDPLSARAVTVNASTATKTTATEGICELMRKPRPDINYDWIPQDSSVFTDLGLDTASYHRIRSLDQYRMFWNQSHLMGYEEFWAKVAENESDTKKAQDAMRRVAELREEFARGAAIDTEYFCVVARKPLLEERAGLDTLWSYIKIAFW